MLLDLVNDDVDVGTSGTNLDTESFSLSVLWNFSS